MFRFLGKSFLVAFTPKTKTTVAFNQTGQIVFNGYSILRSKILYMFYCYACRQYGKKGTGHDIFVTIGFNQWKLALATGKGLRQHEVSALHISAMAAWKEKERRRANNTEISQLATHDILEKRRYYVKSVVDIIIFLAANELALRGNWELASHKETGLFNSLFEFSLQKDERLRECVQSIPQNAKYTSPEIQNQLVSIYLFIKY